MCYSKEQSIYALTVNLVACYLLYVYINKKTSKIFALFFIFVGLMQLYDWILYQTQNLDVQLDRTINYITTRFAIISNHLQPIILALLIYYFNGKLGYYSKIIVALYSIIALFYTYAVLNTVSYTRLMKDKNTERNILFWEWNLLNYYDKLMYSVFIISLAILCFENINNPLNIILLLLTILSFVFSKFIFKREFAGIFWCKISAYIPIFLLILNKLNILSFD